MPINLPVRQLAALIAVASFWLTGCSSLQTRPDAKSLPRGFALRPTGVIDIGDAYFEINYYDSHWTIAQQHDRFNVQDVTHPAASIAEIHGVLNTAGGPADVVETIFAEARGIRYTAAFTAGKPLDSNELAMALILPLASHGGQTMRVDGQPVELPLKPAAKGAAVLFTKDAVHHVTIPTADGELTITGTFALKLNDDREWNDPRYSLRFLFTPGVGAIQSSKIDLHLALTPHG